MKATGFVLAAAMLVLLVTGSALATDRDCGICGDKYALVEKNLLIGLQSDNLGLRESAAYMLGEIQSSAAVVPLMQMLKESDQETSRIVAALALCRIGDARGTYAVKRATTFDASENVQQKCAYFYNEYVQAGSFNFANVSVPGAPEMATR